jgi:hypothetical protein
MLTAMMCTRNLYKHGFVGKVEGYTFVQQKKNLLLTTHNNVHIGVGSNMLIERRKRKNGSNRYPNWIHEGFFSFSFVGMEGGCE